MKGGARGGGSRVGQNLPQLGVFAVRQSPILLHNLIASVTNKPLKSYRPQERFLAILNLGRDQGLATWGPFHWQGRLSLWVKDWIDRRFVNQYQTRVWARGFWSLASGSVSGPTGTLLWGGTLASRRVS
jgi:NADH dehydrogenase FAD-containing subunit